MQKLCAVKRRENSIHLLSEVIDSFSILEDPHIAHRHAEVIPWNTKIYSKSVLGSGANLSWISFNNVLERFIEDVELLCWDAKSKTYRSQCWVLRRLVETRSFDNNISSWVIRAENCIVVIIISNSFWVYVLFFDEAVSNMVTLIEWPVELASDLIHEFIL